MKSLISPRMEQGPRNMNMVAKLTERKPYVGGSLMRNNTIGGICQSQDMSPRHGPTAHMNHEPESRQLAGLMNDPNPV
mgnify:CR=1 FL=1